MMKKLRLLLSKADSISAARFIWINIALSCFIALSHGDPLEITNSRPMAETQAYSFISVASLSLAAIVGLTAVIALIQPRITNNVLAVHGFIISSAAIILFIWALVLIVGGINYSYFHWSVGKLSAFVGYSAFLLCRFTLPVRLRTHPMVFFAPATALMFAVMVDTGVFIRVAIQIFFHFGGQAT